MQNQIQVFTNKEFGKIEVLMIEGKPYFPAAECAIILGYKNPHDAILRHCKSLVKHETPHPQSPGKTIQVNFIPEGDLYRLIIRSKLPAAVRFEAFVCDEILPSIRQYGAYATSETLGFMQQNPEFTAELIRNLSEANLVLMDKVDALTPKAQYCDSILQCSRAVPTTLIAKAYGMTAQAFNKLLHDLKIQYRIGGVWYLYKGHADKGYTVTKSHYVGNKQVYIYTAWTQKGCFWLYDVLQTHDILPVTERPISA